MPVSEFFIYMQKTEVVRTNSLAGLPVRDGFERYGGGAAGIGRHINAISICQTFVTHFFCQRSSKQSKRSV